MANPFAPFSPDKSEFLAASIKYYGHIVSLANHFGVCRATMYEFIHRDPEGKEIIAKTRAINSETELDLAEHVQRYNLLNYKENAAIAQRASEFVLDRKGKSRGWVNDKKDNATEEQKTNVNNVISQLDEVMDKLKNHSSTDSNKP